MAKFVQIASGPKFNPYVTIAIGTEAYLKQMLAEPFEAFTFSPAGASFTSLGSLYGSEGVEGVDAEAVKRRLGNDAFGVLLTDAAPQRVQGAVVLNAGSLPGA